VLTPSLLARLQTAEGERALESAATALEADSDFLRASQRLTPAFGDRLARAAVEQVQLRRHAIGKFPQAERLFFTREGLEQATAEPVARLRAARFGDRQRVFDFGCGLGGDALQLAVASQVVAIDRDPLRLRIVAANAGRLGLADRIQPVEADLHRLPLGVQDIVAFCDPGRRSGGRRLRRVDDYEPPLRTILGWLPHLAGLAVKVSPAVRLDEVVRLDCEIEFVSLGGELKEGVLWFGVLRRGQRRATVLPVGATLEGGDEPNVEVGPIADYLLEPDPAILRAGLVMTLAAALGAHPIQEDVSFLSLGSPRATPFGRTYRVLEASPFRLKSLQETLRQRGIGRVTVKRRGSAVEPEAIARRLRLRGERDGLVILTRHRGLQTMVLAERVP